MTKDRDYYQETIGRIEPDIAAIDASTFHASAAISLFRIANAIEKFVAIIEQENSTFEDSNKD